MDGGKAGESGAELRARGCEIRTDLEAFDLDMLCDFIQQSYWGEGRARDRILRSFTASYCFGAFVEGRQVGFARVVSDGVYHAFLFDVFVLPEFRGRGIARALMTAIFEDERLSAVTGFMLATRDAHELYRKYGFEAAPDPWRYMVLSRPEPAA